MTGGLLVAVLLVIEVLISWRENHTTNGKRASKECRLCDKSLSDVRGSEQNLTSSSFSMIMEKALKMEVVGPARVMILSGQFPSEILMRAPLCREQEMKTRRSHMMDESTSLDSFTHTSKQKYNLPPLSSS